MKSKITITYEGDYSLEVIEDTVYIGSNNVKQVGFTINKEQKLTLPPNPKVVIQIESLESSPLKDRLVYENVTLKTDNKNQLEKITEDIIKSVKENVQRLR